MATQLASEVKSELKSGSFECSIHSHDVTPILLSPLKLGDVTFVGFLLLAFT